MLLQSFCQGVKARMARAGFDWSTLIATLLPVVVELLESCFNNAAELESFAKGKRSQLQLAGLRLKCRRVVKEQGVSGMFRVAGAAAELQAAVLSELDDQATKAAGNIWQEALDEAASVSGVS